VEEPLRKLMQELGEAINQSLSESDHIAETINKIKEAGYDVFLVLECTIGFSKRDPNDPEEENEKPQITVNEEAVGKSKGNVNFTLKDRIDAHKMGVSLDDIDSQNKP
jgi:hypothetical protein